MQEAKMPLALILDIFVAVLLVITIGYAWVLNKRLGSLRRDKGELEKMALNFHMATDRAEESIERLNINVKTLQDSIKKSEVLRDDLIYLSERGTTAADRLEVAVRAARDEAGVSPAPLKKTSKPDADEAPPIPDSVKPQVSGKHKKSPTTLKASTEERAMTDSDAGVSDAERELLKALRSAG
jgi:hypothetical protein